MTDFNLKDKCLFVTGGSRGIGAAIAKKAASLGATVAITYNSNESAAKDVIDSLEGSGHLMFQMSLTDEASIENAATSALKEFGKMDGVVNNAGMTRDQILLRMKSDDFESVINANLNGTFKISKQFLKGMLKARSGAFVHITSVIGQIGQTGQANYAASKAGIEAYSKSLARELAPRGIRSNCIAPGFIDTDMTQELPEEQKKTLSSQIPLGRIATADEIANPTCFLLSDYASYITGHTLSVNGGLFMN